MTVRLDEIAEVVRGVTFSKAEGSSEPVDGRVPVIRAGSIQQSLLVEVGQIWVPEEKVKVGQLIRKHDIIMCMSSGSSDLVGKCAKSDKDWNGSFGAFCAGVRPNTSKCDPSYLYHFLCSPLFRNWTKSSSGANIKNIRASELAAFKIPLPPLEEQKRIAAILDKADTIRRKRQQAMELADQFLRSVFLDMFGDPVTNPKGWKMLTLKDVTEKITDGTHKTPKYVDSGIKFLSAKNILSKGLEWENTKYITIEEHEELIKRCNPEIGDLLLSKSGSLGTTAIIEEDRVFSLFESAALIKPNHNAIDNVFLLHYMKSEPVRNLLLKSTKGVAIKHLHLVDIRGLPVALPPVALQKEFTKIALKLRDKISKLDDSLILANEIFGSLAKDAFKGDLIQNKAA